MTTHGLGPGVVVRALRLEAPVVWGPGGTGSPPPFPPGTSAPVAAPGLPVADWPVLEAAHQAQLIRDFHAIPGVEQVTTAHALPEDLHTRLIRSDGHLIGLEAAAMARPDVAAVGLRNHPYATPAPG